MHNSTICEKNKDISMDTLESVCEQINLRMRPKYKEHFLRRGYKSTDELKKALKRYQVFGDLGYCVLRGKPNDTDFASFRVKNGRIEFNHDGHWRHDHGLHVHESHT